MEEEEARMHYWVLLLRERPDWKPLVFDSGLAGLRGQKDWKWISWWKRAVNGGE